MNSFSEISVNIVASHTLLKTRFFGLHFCPRQYRSIFSHLCNWPPKLPNWVD